MAPNFEVIRGPHSSETRTQWAIQSHELTLDECRLISGVVCNKLTTSADYKAKKGAEPFLQGYQEPFYNEKDGWILVEFWSDNREAIDRFVAHLNKVLAEEENRRTQPQPKSEAYRPPPRRPTKT